VSRVILHFVVFQFRRRHFSSRPLRCRVANLNGEERTIYVEDNASSTGDFATISGNLTGGNFDPGDGSGTHFGGIIKTGPGRLILTGTGNSYGDSYGDKGRTIIAAGAANPIAAPVCFVRHLRCCPAPLCPAAQRQTHHRRKSRMDGRAVVRVVYLGVSQDLSRCHSRRTEQLLILTEHARLQLLTFGKRLLDFLPIES